MTVPKNCPKLGAPIFACSGLAIAALILVFTSCQLPVDASDAGTLSLTIGGQTSRTLLPSISMVPTSYLISGTGPKALTFSTTTVTSTTSVKNLRAGAWQISVNAMNADGTVIAEGSGSVTIVAGTPASLALTISPLGGNGSLDLSLSWPDGLVSTPAIQAQLLPLSGAAIPLAFDIGTGTATSHATGIPAGYYTLTVQLLDGSNLIMGAVEVARIVEGQATTGTFDFSTVNQAIGSLTVSILPVMNDPLEVQMTGQAATITQGGSMSVTASVSNSSANIAYAWYLNGQAFAAGSTADPSVVLGSDLSAGVYRLDVTAWTADGMQAGQATANFTVQ
jgi:hypothetical protein